MNTNKNILISAIVVAKNEEIKIEECLKSLSFADEIVLVDNGSKDKTNEIARRNKAKIIQCLSGSWSEWRNSGADSSAGEWLLYIDADERVTQKLQEEIKRVIKESDTKSLYAIPRRNIILGKEMVHGGWWPDYVKRLIKKKDLQGWKGDLHEEPVLRGEMGYLVNYIIHLKHDNLSEMVSKTNIWSNIEAKLLFDAHHPKMVWWRFLRPMFTELWSRLIAKMGVLDAQEGVIYSIYQMWSRFITYAKLWEKQKNYIKY